MMSPGQKLIALVTLVLLNVMLFTVFGLLGLVSVGFTAIAAMQLWRL